MQFALNEGRPVAQSIPATEHSVMTAWPSEKAAIENMIANFGSSIFACVMDSYDYVKVGSGVGTWAMRGEEETSLAPLGMWNVLG